jgi:hypothetical protein
MKTKTIIPIAVVAIFLTLAFAPAVSAKPVGIGWNPTTGDDTAPEAQYAVIDLTDSQSTKLLELLDSFWNWLQEAKPLQDYTLDESEKAVINEFIYGNDAAQKEGIVDILAACPFIGLITFDNLLAAFLSAPITKSCFVAFGWGKTLMPLNAYEWGFSGGIPFIRPITFLMKFGYTGVVKYRPPLGAMGYDKMGRHIISVQGLQGLWIDGGSLGYERFGHSGIEFAIGRGRVFTLGNH